METYGRPPRKLPTRATRQEKHKSSDAHQGSLQIPVEFLREYDSNLGQLVHHYKECCKKKDHPTKGVYALCVIRDVSRRVLTFVARVPRLRVVSNCVPGTLATFHASCALCS